MPEQMFSSIDFVAQCLVDRKRTSAFESVIRHVVKKGASVIDVGTGSGIFALLAAKSGAGRVVAVEIDPYLVRIASANVRRNHYEHIIKVIQADARTLVLKDKPHRTPFDVVIIEMLTSGMVDEHQVHAINNLFRRRYAIARTRFIPYAQETYAAFAETSFDYVKGIDVRMPIHAWQWYPKNALHVRRLTENALLEVTGFSMRVEESILKNVNFKVRTSGVLNSVIISSRTLMSKKLALGDTLSLNAPVIVPLAQERRVRRGDRIRAEIAYDFGKGYASFRATVRDV